MSDPDPPVMFDVDAFLAESRFRIHFGGDRDPKEREMRGHVQLPGDERPAHLKIPAAIELSRFFVTSPDARRTSRNGVVTPAGNFTTADIASAALRALQGIPEPAGVAFEVLSTWRRATYKPDADFLRHLALAAGVVVRMLPLRERPKRATSGLTRTERNARHRDNLKRDQWATATWSLLEHVYSDAAAPGSPVDVDAVAAIGDRLLAAWLDYVGEDGTEDDVEMFIDDHSRVAIPPTPPRAFSSQRIYEVARALGFKETHPQRRTVHQIPEREMIDMSNLPVLSREEILDTLLRLAVSADPSLFGADAEGVDITVRMKHGGRFTVSQDAPTNTDADNMRRASERITAVLAAGPLSKGRLRNKVARSIRDYADEAIDVLTTNGTITASTDDAGVTTLSLAS